ncbi:MAG TPA: class I SAM-dependent methyltransferase [Acidimicrobiia bacterium]|jgi:SAM-dependent methyltransferase
MPKTSDRVSHPMFARIYARVSPRMEDAGFARRRDQLLRGLHGRVLEVGAGNGLNFAHYPPEVVEVVALEPEARLRELATAAAASEARVVVRSGVAEHLPADDGELDAVVASLVLCSVPELDAALSEMFRVVRPGGELRFVEHVCSETAGLRRVQTGLDATVWPRLFGGCHLARDTASAIAGAGFVIESIDRFDFPDFRPRLPAAPHILGTAVRPTG